METKAQREAWNLNETWSFATVSQTTLKTNGWFISIELVWEVF